MRTKIHFLLGMGVVAAALFMSSSVSAQDIIRTKTGKEIEAKVLEISDKEVTYKMYDNQEGPTIRISTERLYKIFFENGSEYSFVEEVFPHDLPADAPLRDLVADGNNVYIMMDDPTHSFSEKDAYIREYIPEYTPWNVVDNLEDADFILYVEVHMTERFSHVHSATPSIRRPDGTVVWKGRKQRAAPVIQNGFVAVRGVSKEIVREALMVDMWEEIH